MLKKIAVIDIGSNSIRMVIHGMNGKRGLRELHNVKEVARLSSHMDKKNNLTDDGFSILRSVLLRFQEVIDFHKVETVQAAATAAIRNASNCKDIIQFITDETNMPVRVLSGEEEAYYGFLAVQQSTFLNDGITVDIGGGSTEITLFQNKKIIHSHSFPFGALTLKKEFVDSYKKEHKALDAIKEKAKSELKTLPWLLSTKDLPIVGIGGSARNLSLIHQASIDYPLSGLHQYTMKPDDMESVISLLSDTPEEKRDSIEGLSKDRSDTILPAAIIIQSLIEYTSSPYFLMSNKGLRDGLLMEEMQKEHPEMKTIEVEEESFYQLKEEFEVNNVNVEQVGFIADSLYTKLLPHLPEELIANDQQKLLRKSVNVLYIGEYISYEASSQHTFYLLTNRSIDGISHQDRMAMAFIASFKSKSWLQSFSKPFKQQVDDKLLTQYELLGSILKLAYALNRTNRNVIDRLEVQNERKELHFTFYSSKDISPVFEMMKSEKHKKHLEKVLDRSITLHFL